MEYTLSRDVKGNKEYFWEYIGDEKDKGKCGPIAQLGGGPS